MKGRYLYILLLLIFYVSSVAGQSFTARVSAKTIGKRDRLQVEYVTDNAEVSQFRMPAFAGWVVLSGPNITSNRVVAGSVQKQQVIYSVTLVPKVTGRLLVPSASALLNNRPAKTNPIYIQVKNIDHIAGGQQRTQQPSGSIFDQQPTPRVEFGSDQFLRQGESARDKINQNIQVRVEANKRTAVVGEPILITYKLYTRLRSQSKVVSQPSFTGATVIEMTTENPLATRETLNGKMYNSYVVRRVQLIPLQEGVLNIPEAAVENTVAFYDASNINYRDLYYNLPSLPVQEVTVTQKNKPIQIEIKNLPPYPNVGPNAFSGAVGTFELSVSTDKKTLATDATNNLEVVIIGEGNMQQMKPPVIKWPAGFEAFEPQVKSQEDKTFFPVRSRKVFSYPFVVNKPGQYILAPITFTYYDAAQARYITKQTPPITLLVNPGQGTNKVKEIFSESGQGFNRRLMIIIGAALLAIIIGIVWFKDRNRKPSAAVPANPVNLPLAEVEEQDASKHIYQVRELWPQQDTSSFYKELYKHVNAYIEARLKIKPHELQEYIANYSGYKEPFQQLQELLNNCTLGMYTPVYSIDEAMQHRLMAIEIMNGVEREVVK